MKKVFLILLDHIPRRIVHLVKYIGQKIAKKVGVESFSL